ESGSGTTTVQGGATFTTSNFSLDGGHTLALGGSSVASGTSVAINLNGTNTDLGSGILKILAGATFDDQTTAATGNGLSIWSNNFGGDNGGDAVVNNLGTFKKSGTATTSTISTTFNNTASAVPGSGTVNVLSGKLVFTGTVNNAGQMIANGGNITIGGPLFDTTGAGFAIDNATIELAAVSGGTNVTFGGTSGVLQLDS